MKRKRHCRRQRKEAQSNAGKRLLDMLRGTVRPSRDNAAELSRSNFRMAANMESPNADGVPYVAAAQRAALRSFRRSGSNRERRYPLRPLLKCKRIAGAVFVASAISLIAVSTHAQSALDESEERVIHYESNEGLADPVTQLQKKIAAGSNSLAFETKRGYLRSLLEAFDIPASSQTLVFSKTSSQRAHTSPATPRAIYFSDRVSVGWAPDASEIDLASIDPTRGPVFYTLSQASGAPAKFTRRGDCMQCHLGPKTSHVPGLLVRSYFTAPTGTPVATVNEFLSGHDAPIVSRWGGWYVTGEAGAAHLGNIFVAPNQPANQLEVATTAKASNHMSLENHFDTTPYLSAESDVVALLVLEHQTRMQNLLTHARYETLLALAERSDARENSEAATVCKDRIARAGDMLLEYMLFRHEAPLSGPVRGSSSYTKEFQSMAARDRDRQGRSLRELDLHTRLFRYPCSYLIYSPSFDALPREMKNYLWARLEPILIGHDKFPPFATMNEPDRKAVLQILRDTKPEFASFLAQSHARVSEQSLSSFSSR
jgi:hypothetical protein